MARALLLLLAGVLVIGPSCGLYTEESAVTLLDDSNFEEQVLKSDDAFWLVEFYAPWCGHCKNLVPTYEKVAKNLAGLVKVGAMDAEANPKIASQAGIRGYPTLKLYPVEQTFNPYTKKSAKLASDYNGPRTAKGMVDTVLGSLPNYVHVVHTDNSTDFLEDEYPKALLFTDKKEVSPLFKSLAIQFRGRMRLGMAQSADEELAKKFGVEAFPKLVVVPGSDASKHVKHEGKIKKEELISFLGEHSLKEKKEDPLLAAKLPKAVTKMSAEEFKTQVLEDSKHMWLTFFHKGGKVPSDVEQLAKSMKIFKSASVDCAKETALCKEHGASTLPALRVYQEDKSEYEDFTGTAACEEDCMELDAMSDFVADQMPDLIVPVNEANFNNWVAPAAERPRALLLSKKAEPTPLYRSVAQRYKNILTFGLMPNPPQQIMQQMQVTKLPQLLFFFSQNGTAESIQAMPYSGGFTFEEMTQVLDQLAAPFMEGSKSEKKATTSEAPKGPVPEIGTGEGSGFEDLCGKTGLCALAFIDGSPENKEKREEQLKTLEDLRKKKHPSPFRYAWVDAVCHPEFAMSFDISSDKVPTLAVISSSKERYHTHVGKFNVNELENTLDGVLTGKKQTGPYSRVGDLESKACTEVHAEIAASMSAGAEEDDDDIMKEMMEEIKRKEAEKAAEEDEDDDSSKKKKKKKKKKSKK